jgi:hypothetical protein
MGDAAHRGALGQADPARRRRPAHAAAAGGLDRPKSNRADGRMNGAVPRQSRQPGQAPAMPVSAPNLLRCGPRQFAGRFQPLRRDVKAVRPGRRTKFEKHACKIPFFRNGSSTDPGS